MDSLLADLQRERQQFGPTMTNDECVALIDAVLWKNRGHGFKQPEKPGSGNNGRRRDGKLCSVDGIVLSNPGQPDDRTFIDALKDAGGGGKSIPAWQVRKIGSVASDGTSSGLGRGQCWIRSIPVASRLSMMETSKRYMRRCMSCSQR